MNLAERVDQAVAREFAKHAGGAVTGRVSASASERDADAEMLAELFGPAWADGRTRVLASEAQQHAGQPIPPSSNPFWGGQWGIYGDPNRASMPSTDQDAEDDRLIAAVFGRQG